MSYKEYLISGISCCFGGCPYYFSLSAYDLLMFTLGSFVVILILLFYYNRIPKSNSPKDTLQNSIYSSKDILLQSISSDDNYLLAEKSTSIFTKVVLFIIIGIVIYTPFYKLIGIDYFI